MIVRAIVVGAKGKMGSETIKMIQAAEDMELVCAVDRTLNQVDVGEAIGIGPIERFFYNDIQAALENEADVLIDFTTPDKGKVHAQYAIERGVRPIIGTTGLSEEDVQSLRSQCQERKLGGMIVPNFAIGAVLMMNFARQAAKYMADVEIIEMHHDRKLDAPSGTAVKTAELISEVREEHRQGHEQEQETMDGARGAFYQGFPIHSVRLPGLVAHQQVMFGAEGQTLTIRHDTINRTSFMPGVHLAAQKVMELDELVYGLEHVLDI